MRDTNRVLRKHAGAIARRAMANVIVALALVAAVLHPWLAGLAIAALLVALLVPPARLGLLLRVVMSRDRHAHFRLVRLAPSQAFPPAAFGNSSGGRNVS